MTRAATGELEFEAIVAEAETPDTGPHLDALRQLTQALREEARLHPRGATAVHNSLVGALRTRSAVSDLHLRQPEVAALPVVRPIFVTGLLRTGTTLAQNLLTVHPALRAPDLWELMLPVTAGTQRTSFDAMADRAQGYVDEYYTVAPLLRAMHFLDARRPDECHRLTGNAFASMVYGMRYRVPSYDRWLAEAGMVDAYREHRRHLQAILWRRPARQVVLKCPFHLWSLPDLAEVYPDARIVVMHRDPAVTVVSTCLLCETVRGARSAQIDRHEIGRQWTENIAVGQRRFERARTELPASVTLIDVTYDDLTRRPIETMRRICDEFGVGLDDQAEAAMNRYLADHPQYSTGSYRYQPQDYGLAPIAPSKALADL